MRTLPFGIIATIGLLGASGAPAQQPPAHPAQPPAAHQAPTAHQTSAPATHQTPAAGAYRREVPAALAREARITEDSARGIAMRRVPGGAVQALELERENGHLIYSFDLTIAGHPGIAEVHVDALNGSILAVEHEAERADSGGQRSGARSHADTSEHRRAAPAHPAPAPRRP